MVAEVVSFMTWNDCLKEDRAGLPGYENQIDQLNRRAELSAWTSRFSRAQFVRTVRINRAESWILEQRKPNRAAEIERARLAGWRNRGPVL